jgi:hypothetical protein
LHFVAIGVCSVYSPVICEVVTYSTLSIFFTFHYHAHTECSLHFHSHTHTEYSLDIIVDFIMQWSWMFRWVVKKMLLYVVTYGPNYCHELNTKWVVCTLWLQTNHSINHFTFFLKICPRVVSEQRDFCALFCPYLFSNLELIKWKGILQGNKGLVPHSLSSKETTSLGQKSRVSADVEKLNWIKSGLGQLRYLSRYWNFGENKFKWPSDQFTSQNPFCTCTCFA